MSTPDPAPAIVVRRRWNDPSSVAVPVESLFDFHLRDEAGGVCRASPRAFLSAHAWCDRIDAQVLGHRCDAGDAPHDLVVCVLPNDQPPEVYAALLRRLRR